MGSERCRAAASAAHPNGQQVGRGSLVPAGVRLLQGRGSGRHVGAVVSQPSTPRRRVHLDCLAGRVYAVTPGATGARLSACEN